MNATKPKVIQNINKHTDVTESIQKNEEIGWINEEKEMIIERYENVLNFLKGVQMNNAEDLVHIKKPLDDLESNLKYIPNGPFFNDILPTEIKDSIFSMSCSCDSKAFVAASVCQEWKGVLENRFKGTNVRIEKCSSCEDIDCVTAADMLKAAAAHKLDVHLVICDTVTEVDPKLVTDALTSVSKFTIANEVADDFAILSVDQFDHLFASIEKGDKILEEVNLIQLDLKCLNQEILANCLVTKIKRLTLDQEYYDIRMLNIETFLSKLLQDSNKLKLTHLTLIDITFFEDLKSQSGLCSFVANALCNVENVKLCFKTKTPMKPLLENLVKTSPTMKTLIIDMEDYRNVIYDFGSLISPEDLRSLFNAMSTLQLMGVFTLDQREAVTSLPDVKVGQIQFYDSEEIIHYIHYIRKGSTEMF